MQTRPIEVADIVATAGEGGALPEALRQQMEAFFNARFDDVRLSIDDRLPARGIAALACGSRLAIAPAAYAPDTVAGRSLIAHELMHVLQQREGALATAGLSRPTVFGDEALEAEAEAAATMYAIVDSAGLGAVRNAIVRSEARSPAADQGLAVQCVLLHARDAVGKVGWVARKNGYSDDQVSSASKLIEQNRDSGVDTLTVTGLDGNKYGHESTGEIGANPENKSVSVWWKQSFGAGVTRRTGSYTQETERNDIADAISICGLGTHLPEYSGKPAYRLLWRVSAGLADRFYIKSNTVTLMPAPG